MRQAAVIGFSVLLLLLLQVTVLPILFSAAVHLDLLLILTVSSGLLFGREKAVGVGFLSGLLQDLAAGSLFGLHTLSKMAIGYLSGLAEQKVFKEHILLPMAAMLLATLLNSGLLLIFLAVFGYRYELSGVVAGEFFPSLPYNLLFSIPVHQTVYRLSKRWE